MKIDYFKGLDIPKEEFLIKCMHCGLCLPTCPTYSLTVRERSTPRGRIRLIKSVADGNLPITKLFFNEMYFCLDCQACETACPAGVKYGSLVEAARVQIENTRFNSLLSKIIKAFIFRFIFISKNRVKFLAYLLKFYQKSGLQFLIRKTRILRLFSKHLDNIEGLAPRISKKFSDKMLKEKIFPENQPIKKVGFFYGCFMNVMFADINMDTIDVLLKNNCEIIVPKTQECCGSMHAHNGDMETARILAKKNIDAFINSGLDAIIVNAAGCSAFMKEYGHLFEPEDEYYKKSIEFSSKVKDILEFLNCIDMYIPDKEYKKKFTYHDACHHVHTQKIFDQPRDLLKKMPGFEIIEMNESTWCCGSAGIYNIINYDDSMKILNRKMNNIKNTKTDIVLIGNPGCLAQIRYGIEKEGLCIRAIHPITLINEAYKNEV